MRGATAKKLRKDCLEKGLTVTTSVNKWGQQVVNQYRQIKRKYTELSSSDKERLWRR
jgi:hypothetical protein